MSNTPTKDILPAKRSGDSPPPAAKRGKMDPSDYFEEEAGVQEAAVDFAMELLEREHDKHTYIEPSLEFSVAPHRSSIGLRSSEFSTQICATVKACELPAGDMFARAPVDIVVALDVSGSMVSQMNQLILFWHIYHKLNNPLSHIMLGSVWISWIFARRLSTYFYVNFTTTTDSV